MPAYGFAHLRERRHHPEILDYLDRIQATLDPFHGRFIVHGPPAEVVEGTWPGSMVLIEFPDLAVARAWYRSPAYQEIKHLRADHINGDLLLIDGVGPAYDPRRRGAVLRAAEAPSADDTDLGPAR
ncbi:DUF1330 domain-containing protein [Streptomyces rubiginosohelvolus]|uniref:DUF1330 domain-containing protein n=1 Tax=Streptomyces rubiginosohelvolus TaxID=67362 RepID=UPI0037F9970C